MVDISYRDVKAHISQGWGWEDFEAKYGLTRGELKRHIFDDLCQSKGWARGIVRNITRNSKRKAKVSKQNAESVPTNEKEVVCDNRNETARSIDAMIADLREREETERETVIQLELEHKGLVEQHRASIKALRAIERDVKDIQSTLRAKGAEYERIVGDIDVMIAKMRSTSSERREHVATLDDIRQQITELETVVVCAYADGTIAPYDGQIDAPLDDTGYEALLPELIVAEACQDLRAKDLRTLARLIRIVKNAEMKVEVISEIEGLEQALSTLLDTV